MSGMLRRRQCQRHSTAVARERQDTGFQRAAKPAGPGRRRNPDARTGKSRNERKGRIVTALRRNRSSFDRAPTVRWRER